MSVIKLSNNTKWDGSCLGIAGIDKDTVLQTKSVALGSHNNETVLTASSDGWCLTNIGSWNGRGYLYLDGALVKGNEHSVMCFPIKKGQKITINSESGSGTVTIYGVK